MFTFGAGMYGQLGHNSNQCESLPRKVFELMGSEVTMLACGRLVCQRLYSTSVSAQFKGRLLYYAYCLQCFDTVGWALESLWPLKIE